MTTLAAFLASLGALLALFALVFALARRLDNYGIVDVAWSLAFGALALFHASTLPGWPERRWLIAAMAVVWSLRLGLHLARRVAAAHPVEDARYREMRARWAPRFGSAMFGFFLVQGASVAVLGLPILLAMADPTPAFRPLEAVGAVVWFAGVCGEGLADLQLATFKRLAPGRGEICRFGLWRYCRHPNYFFSWLVWVGLALFALPAPFGWLGLSAPAVILYLLLRVTGIPPSEEQALRHKGEAWLDYRRTTNAFFPWRPRGRRCARSAPSPAETAPAPADPRP